MKPEQIFIGNIKKCTQYEEHTAFSSNTKIGSQCICEESFGYIIQDSEIFKENAILIKVKNGGYVDLENLNSILDHIKIWKDTSKYGYRLNGLMMSTLPDDINDLFVDSKSLKPYYTKEQPKSISTRQLKKQLKFKK